MKILLDHCVPRRVNTLFPGHTVTTAHEAGLSALQNGELLAAAGARFDVLITTDKNMRHQHHIEQLPVAVIELNALFTRFDDLRRLAPHFETALQATEQFLFVSVDIDGIAETLGERPAR